MTTSTITASGLTKSFGDHVVLDGIDLDVAAGTVFALLGPNGAGKTTTVRILSHPAPARRRDRDRRRVRRGDRADGVRAAIGVTGQFSAVDNLMTGRENLRLMADLWHLDRPRRRAPAPTSCSARLDLRRRRRPGGVDVLRRHGAPARPRHDAGEPSAGRLPRRAEHRARPAEPARRCGRSCEELVADGVTVLLTTQYLEEADQARGPDRPAGRRTHRRAGHAATSSSARSPAVTCGWTSRTRPLCGGAIALWATARAGPRLGRARGAWRRQRAAGARRARPARLGGGRGDAGWPCAHPDLDDVFLALTGRTATHDEATDDDARELETSDEHSHLRRHRLGHHAAPQPPAHAPLPVADPDADRASRSCSCCSSSTSSATPWAPASPAAGGGRADYLTYITPAIVVMAVASVAIGTAVSVAMDMTQGIVARFRTMPIARVSRPDRARRSVRSLQTALAVAVVDRRSAGARLPARARSAPEWLGVVGMIVLLALALTWLTVALGRAGRQRRDREQHADAPDPAAVPRQRLRADRLDADRGALVRGVPAVHPDDRDAAWRCWPAPRPGTDAVLAIGWCVLITVV